MSDSSENKNVVKNIFLVALSNIISLLSGVMVGFVLPKIMSKPDYGYYKTFTLYFSYIGLFPLGFIDGIYLLYAGMNYDSLSREKFRLYTKFLLWFQVIVSIIFIIISIPFLKSITGFIIFSIGINVFFNSLSGYYQIISQITYRFKELSWRNIIKAILTSISIIILMILFFFGIINDVKFQLFILITTVISIFLTLLYMYTYRDITFGKCANLREEIPNIKKFFVIGFPLLVANLISSLILNLDRQFVSVLFNIDTYASYAFAYNMLSLITTVISAISTVLYPTIKVYDKKRLEKNYCRLSAIILMIVALSLAAYFPLKFIIDNFLSNYLDSLPYFRIILPGLLISSPISMIMFNYYKSLEKQNVYFLISAIILCVSFCANAAVYYIFKTPEAISVVSIFVMMLWYLITEIYLVRKIDIRPIKNIIYILVIVAIFYIITFYVENVFIGIGIYLVLCVLFSYAFYFKLINKKFKEIL